MTDPDALAEALLELTTALTIEFHPAIAEFHAGPFRGGRPGRRSGVPTASGGEPTHRSGAASAPVAALAEQAAAEAAERLAYGRRDGNPFLPSLALAAFYLVEARRTGAFGLAALAAAGCVDSR